MTINFTVCFSLAGHSNNSIRETKFLQKIYCTAITCTTFRLLCGILQVNVKSAWLLTVVICCDIAVADLGFPRPGAPTPKMGAPTYYLLKISQKLALALLMHCLSNSCSPGVSADSKPHFYASAHKRDFH